MYMEDDLKKELEQIMGKCVVVSLDNGGTLSGKLVGFSKEWIKLDTNADTVFVEALSITAIKVSKSGK